MTGRGCRSRLVAWVLPASPSHCPCRGAVFVPNAPLAAGAIADRHAAMILHERLAAIGAAALPAPPYHRRAPAEHGHDRLRVGATRQGVGWIGYNAQNGFPVH